MKKKQHPSFNGEPLKSSLKNGQVDKSVSGDFQSPATEKLLLKKIALHIKKIRKAAGVSQERFQSDTNIHIARVETGKLNISLNTLFRICEYFELSIADFFESLNES